jgi:hypothetical protein
MRVADAHFRCERERGFWEVVLGTGGVNGMNSLAAVGAGAG